VHALVNLCLRGHLQTSFFGRSSSHDLLLGILDSSDFLASSHHVLVLDTHNTTTPGLSKLFVLVVIGGERLTELSELGAVLDVHSGEGDTGGRLHVDELAKVGLAADEAVRDIELTAKGGEEDDHLNGIDIVGNDDELGFLGLNELGDVVKTEFDVVGLVTLISGLVSGHLSKTCLLFDAGLGHVFAENFKELGLLITCNGALELGNAWRDLQTLHKDSLLPLNTDVLGPPDEAGEVSLGLDVSANSEVVGVLLEQRFFGLGFAAVLLDEHGPLGGCLFDHFE